MKKDNLEVTLLILATSVLLLIIMITILVINIERKILEKPFVPPVEEKIEPGHKSFRIGTYYNTSDATDYTSITFNQDNSFKFTYNNCETSNVLTGTYTVQGNYIYLTLLEETDLEKEFVMVVLSDNLLEYRGQSIGCSPYEYSVYMLR